MSNNSNSKRLAKNTILLYTRTFLVMLVGFYTSRVILAALGVTDYGINNVVAGFIAMFSIVSGTLTATTQRYITYEIGKGPLGNVTKVFGAAMGIHFAICIVLLILFETIGVYFLNHGLNIPANRMYAANWVFQFAILSTLLNILNSPYLGVIVAHEKMSAFAYMSIFDVMAKLAIVYLLYVISFDRLITYSFLFLLVSIVDRIIYNYYCRKHFTEAKITLVKDKPLYKEMFGFAGMNFLGSFASLLSSQGINIILNLFFGVVVNAAVGIANQVQSLATKFVGDFMTAINPQITKEYASGNLDQSRKLSLRGSKFSYFLALILACPIIVRTPYILDFWLKNYPEQAIIFSRLAIVLTMISLLSNSLITEMLATGNLTSTTWWIGGTRLLILPIAALVLYIFHEAYYALLVQIGMEIVSLFIRLVILKKISGIEFLTPFVQNVLLPISLVTAVSFGLTVLVQIKLPQNFIGLCIMGASSVIFTLGAIYSIGLTKHERVAIVNMAKDKLKKRSQKE